MGADHTAGLIAMPVADPARASQDSQIVNAICDSSGFCQFMTPTADEMKRLFNMMYGLNLSDEDIINLGWQCLQDEWEFNRRAGFTEADDKFPDWMSTEAIPTNGAVFDVPTDEIRRVFTKMPVTPELMQMHPTG
jgi:aldehyde:ferredoxin oxidoreductase